MHYSVGFAEWSIGIFFSNMQEKSWQWRLHGYETNTLCTRVLVLLNGPLAFFFPTCKKKAGSGDCMGTRLIPCALECWFCWMHGIMVVDGSRYASEWLMLVHVHVYLVQHFLWDLAGSGHACMFTDKNSCSTVPPTIQQGSCVLNFDENPGIAEELYQQFVEG